MSLKLKDILCRKILDATCLKLLVFCTVKIEIEPMSKFNLEEDSNQVLPFFFWNIDDKTTEKKKKRTNEIT